MQDATGVSAKIFADHGFVKMMEKGRTLKIRNISEDMRADREFISNETPTGDAPKKKNRADQVKDNG